MAIPQRRVIRLVNTMRTMPGGDRVAWWLNYYLNITVVCNFNKVILVNFAITGIFVFNGG
jgi:hypothetical protein